MGAKGLGSTKNEEKRRSKEGWKVWKGESRNGVKVHVGGQQK